MIEDQTSSSDNGQVNVDSGASVLVVADAVAFEGIETMSSSAEIVVGKQ